MNYTLLNGTIEAPITGDVKIYMSDIIKEVCLWDGRFLVQLSLLLFACAVLVGYSKYSLWFIPEKVMVRVRDTSDFLLTVGIWLLPIYMIWIHEGNVYNKALYVLIASVLVFDILRGLYVRFK